MEAREEDMVTGIPQCSRSDSESPSPLHLETASDRVAATIQVATRLYLSMDQNTSPLGPNLNPRSQYETSAKAMSFKFE